MSATMPPIENAVRFQLVGKSNPLILVPAFADESGPHEFLLDSGATRSMLSQELASRLGTEQESLDDAFGAGGSRQLGFGTIKALRVGPAAQEGLTLGIADDLAAIGDALNVRVDGLIGFDFIKNFRMTIDYRQQIIVFDSNLQNGGMHLPSLNAVRFELTPKEPLMLVATYINDRGPFQFVVDTAAGKTVIAQDLIERIGIAVQDRKAGMGFGGNFELARATLDSVRLSDIVVYSLPVITGPFLNAIGSSLGAKVDGIIGNDFLRKFPKVTICGIEGCIVFDKVQPSV
jgi:predicted aspartyl protease